MVLKVTGDKNMGELKMPREQAKGIIEKARNGGAVDPVTLQRACVAMYNGREPRKPLIPVLNAAERMRVNCVLIWNLSQATIARIREKSPQGAANDSEAGEDQRLHREEERDGVPGRDRSADRRVEEARQQADGSGSLS